MWTPLPSEESTSPLPMNVSQTWRLISNPQNRWNWCCVSWGEVIKRTGSARLAFSECAYSGRVTRTYRGHPGSLWRGLCAEGQGSPTNSQHQTACQVTEPPWKWPLDPGPTFKGLWPWLLPDGDVMRGSEPGYYQAPGPQKIWAILFIVVKPTKSAGSLFCSNGWKSATLEHLGAIL